MKKPEEILKEWHEDLAGDIARKYNKSNIIGAMIEYAEQQVNANDLLFYDNVCKQIDIWVKEKLTDRNAAFSPHAEISAGFNSFKKWLYNKKVHK